MAPFRPRTHLTGVTSLSALLLCSQIISPAAAQETQLILDTPQTAGISGFRQMWDVPVPLAENGAQSMEDKGKFGKALSARWFPTAPSRVGLGDLSVPLRPGALAFDAVHRSLLVRFPGAAQSIAAKLKEGNTIAKVELLLPFKGTELWAEGYAEPSGMSFLNTTWATSVPQWHAVAWALRKPWQADLASGPTFNAYINGAGYWKKYGAADETEDRFPQRFGPAKVSAPETQPLDVTALLDSPDFGARLEDRLRKLEYCGFWCKSGSTMTCTASGAAMSGKRAEAARAF